MRSRLSIEEKSWLDKPLVDGQAIETLHRTFHDYKTISGLNDGTVSVQSSYSFFNSPSGSSVGAVVQTKEDCNIYKPNSFGMPYKFLLQEVAVVIMPASRAYITGSAPTADKTIQADAVQIMSRGVATLKILGVDQLEVAPLMALPAGIGVNYNTAQNASLGAITAENGWPVLSNRYPVSCYMYGDVTFEFLIDFPKGIFAVYNAIRFGVVFDGILQRPRSK